jgi:hypothetical protein
MPLSGVGRPDPLERAEELAGEPHAARWAQECAWVPGTGHCRNRKCDHSCIFRRQRQAEAKRLERWRRLRRIFLRRRVR